MTKILYRGVSYDTVDHEATSNLPVEHTYRGQHYQAALHHDAASTSSDVELLYRGHAYHHRQQEAAAQVNQA